MSASSLDQRLEATAELAMQIASGNLDARLAVSERGDSIDAVVTVLNMLAEELQHEKKSRRRAEELLQDEVDAYENAPALFCSLDGQSLIIENCNQTLADALGIPKRDIVGRRVLELYAPECREVAERSLVMLPVGRPSSGAEAYLCTVNGGRVIVSTGATRIQGSDGRERLRVVWRDVTAERGLEAQLVQAQKLEAIGRLSAGIAHDFNNILLIVTGATSLLGELLKANSLASEDIELIYEAVARGASLTRDLLAFSRRQVVKPTATDVRAVMREAERMVSRLVGDAIEVSTDIGDDVLSVLIDPSQLSQVLLNLAINARDAMSAGGKLRMGATSVTLDSPGPSEAILLPPGAYALIAVQDSGAGMTADVLLQAFEPFFTTKPLGSGSGLGLSVCYGIIRQAGGRIGIHSEVGRGTTVKVYLPLTEERPGPASPANYSAPRVDAESLLMHAKS